MLNLDIFTDINKKTEFDGNIKRGNIEGHRSPEKLGRFTDEKSNIFKHNT